ncbi:MAG: hypothetical protein FWD46_06415 [Cystobacterineae bacterium]|nr:hypothetical protein [Cystobacterineae bacterium]
MEACELGGVGGGGLEACELGGVEGGGLEACELGLKAFVRGAQKYLHPRPSIHGGV